MRVDGISPVRTSWAQLRLADGEPLTNLGQRAGDLAGLADCNGDVGHSDDPLWAYRGTMTERPISSWGGDQSKSQSDIVGIIRRQN